MRTSESGRSRRQNGLCIILLITVSMAEGRWSAAKAESDGGAFPASQYASLPAINRADEPAATGSLPNSNPKSKPGSHFSRSLDLGAIVLRKGAPTGCLPAALRDVVADVSTKFGEVSVESTHRNAGRNRRAGGAGHSLHLACRAVDFRVHARARGVMAYLRSRPDVGGLKIYRNGIIHIDNGERRSW